MPPGIVRSVVAACCICMASASIAQKRAMTMDEYRAGNAGTSLDSTYRSAMHDDNAKAVFSGRTKAFAGAWRDFLRELMVYLERNGFIWEQQVQCTTRVYFSKDGGVDHFLYSFREGVLTTEQLERFDQLLNAFVETHGFPLKADEPFAQCGPVVFKAPEKAPAPWPASP